MQSIGNLILFFLLPLLFIGCDQDEGTTLKTKHFVVMEQGVNEFFEFPVVSTYKFPERNSGPRNIFPVDTSTWYHDGVILGDKLYTFSVDRNLRKTDLNSYKIEITHPLHEKVNFLAESGLPLMTQFQDHVVVAGTYERNGQKDLKLKIYNNNLVLQDSLVYEDIDLLLDIKSDDESLYMSVEQNSENFLFKIDDLSSAPRSLPLLAEPCSEIIFAGDTVLAALPDEIMVVDKAEFTSITNIPLAALQDKIQTPHNHFAYDQIEHALYYLKAASDNKEGERFHYYLATLDLHSGQTTPAVAESQYHYAPLHFDKDNSVIVVSHLAGLTFYSRDGNAISHVSPYGGRLEKLLFWK